MAQFSNLCVGIDPSARVLAAWGAADSVDGLRSFCETFVEAIGNEICVVKPQASWFERFGAAGVLVLEGLVAELGVRGVPVLLDVKRGDIGETNLGYAQAYLAPGAPMRVDAMTAHAYLGVDALSPLFDAAASHGAGVFVVAHSSNPEGRHLQESVDVAGVSVGDQVLDAIAAEPTGVVGAVIGATLPGARAAAERLGSGRLVLAPGIGAQGATISGARDVFGDRWGDVIPSVSREVLLTGSVAECRSVIAQLQAEAS